MSDIQLVLVSVLLFGFFFLVLERLLFRKIPVDQNINYDNLTQSLQQDSDFSFEYIILVISSCLIASFGLVFDNSVIIIGAMIVAPLILPLRALSFGITYRNIPILLNAFQLLFLTVLLSFTFSFLMGKLISISDFGLEIKLRTGANIIDLLIAIIAGFISGYAKVNSRLRDATAGTAIAVALMPPLCVVGLTLSQGNFVFAIGALSLFLINLLGIIVACSLVYANLNVEGFPHGNRWMKYLFLLLLPSLLVIFAIQFEGLVSKVKGLKQKERFDREWTEKVTIIVEDKYEKNVIKYDTRLQEAYDLAHQEKYREAIDKAKEIPKTSNLYQEAQKKKKQWENIIVARQRDYHKKTLQQAYDLAHQEKYKEAIDKAKEIPNTPKTSEVYQEAQKKIQEWAILQTEK